MTNKQYVAQQRKLAKEKKANYKAALDACLKIRGHFGEKSALHDTIDALARALARMGDK